MSDRFHPIVFMEGGRGGQCRPDLTGLDAPHGTGGNVGQTHPKPAVTGRERSRSRVAVSQTSVQAATSGAVMGCRRAPATSLQSTVLEGAMR